MDAMRQNVFLTAARDLREYAGSLERRFGALAHRDVVYLEREATRLEAIGAEIHHAAAEAAKAT